MKDIVSEDIEVKNPTGWDQSEIPASNVKPLFDSSKIVKKDIEIKLQTSMVQEKKEEPTSKPNPFSKWEPVEEKDDNKKELKKYFKLCAQISSKEGHTERTNEIESGNDVHHPFAVKPAPFIMPQVNSSRTATPMVSHFLHFRKSVFLGS